MYAKRKISVLTLLFITTVLLLSTAASAATSTRALPASVSAGEQFTVSMEVSDYGFIGGVVETLPEGFSFVDSTLASGQVYPDPVNNSVLFLLWGDSSFEYSVMAPTTGDTYTFSGVIQDEDKNKFAVGGASSVEVIGDVEPPVTYNASAVRTLPVSVEQGEQFNVSVSVADYGLAGQLTETIPAGFAFVGSSDSFDQTGQTVTFPLLGDDVIEYTVTAATAEGVYQFVGSIKDFNEVESAVIGDDTIDLRDSEASEEPVAGGAIAIRTLPASVSDGAGGLEPGETFNVSIEASGYGTIGSVVETLPEGFSFVSSTLDTSQAVPDPANNTVLFLLMGDSSFEYSVMASSTEDTYQFSGIIEDEDRNEFAVTGDSSITVVAPPVLGADIPLDMGWNFISIPSVLVDPGVDNVLAGVSYDALMYYNTQNDTWDPVTEFEPLKGYWINVTGADQFIMASEIEIDVSSGILPIDLYAGWNAIGSANADALSAEQTLASIDGSYVNVWGAWDPVAHSYEYFGHNGNSGVISGNHVGTDVFEMNPYEGYWVYLTQDDVLNAVIN